MKSSSKMRMLSLILVFVLIAAAALTGCSGTPAETTEAPEPAGQTTVLGEGSKTMDFTVVDKEGITHLYTIHTDAETVGQALMQVSFNCKNN